MTVTKVFEFDNFSNTDKFKEFKYEYSNKMSKAMDFNEMQNLIEGIKCGMYSSYEYISDGTIWVEPDGVENSTDKFDITIKPKGSVDRDKGYFTPNQLEVVIQYEDD